MIVAIFEVKILIEGVQTGLRNVVPVEVVEHVKDPELGKHPRVQLADNSLLQLLGVVHFEAGNMVNVGDYIRLRLQIRRDFVERSAALLMLARLLTVISTGGCLDVGHNVINEGNRMQD